MPGLPGGKNPNATATPSTSRSAMIRKPRTGRRGGGPGGSPRHLPGLMGFHMRHAHGTLSRPESAPGPRPSRCWESQAIPAPSRREFSDAVGLRQCTGGDGAWPSLRPLPLCRVTCVSGLPEAPSRPSRDSHPPLYGQGGSTPSGLLQGSGQGNPARLGLVSAIRRWIRGTWEGLSARGEDAPMGTRSHWTGPVATSPRP